MQGDVGVLEVDAMDGTGVAGKCRGCRGAGGRCRGM